MTDYILHRSKRKTIALYVRAGGIEVRAPLRMPKRDIDSFVASKQQWITDRSARIGEQLTRRASFSLDYGSLVTYRGKQYPIMPADGDVGFDNERFCVPPNLSPEQIKSACVHVYRALAKRDLTERTYHFAKQMNVLPSAIKISNAKTRWGICSSRKTINLSWRLMMADSEVIDYVVVHELAHLLQMNHSARFWAIVAGILPDYRERKIRLRELQRRLACECWEV